MNFKELESFYKGKKVFVTGHTGFKGSWLCFLLHFLGAECYGYALKPPTTPNAFEIMSISNFVHSHVSDIRDYDNLCSQIAAVNPEIVFHLAAQPIVRESYRIPRDTYEINAMGTVNLLEAIRNCDNVISVLNITTDKVYENSDISNHPFREDEKLDGFDPYSNSKSCSELITHAYKNSFFQNDDSPAISTARAGNVIGGGDFAKDRIIPDCVRASVKNEPIIIRNPHSTRPYQHVLEPLFAYLLIAMMQVKNHDLADYYNVGSDISDCKTTGQLADLFVKYWGGEVKWLNQAEINSPHESSFLQLDCSKIKSMLQWKPVWSVEEAVGHTVSWYKAWHQQKDMAEFTENQIKTFLQDAYE